MGDVNTPSGVFGVPAGRRKKRVFGSIDPEVHEAQRAAQAVAAEQAAAEAAERARVNREKAVQLQRDKRDRRVERLLGSYEDVAGMDDEPVGHISDEDMAAGAPQPRASGQHSGKPSHGQRVLLLEQGRRESTEQAILYRQMFSRQHAAAAQEDLENRLATVQRRVINYVESGALHPNCSATEPRVEVVSWRHIVLRLMLGSGVLRIPILK